MAGARFGAFLGSIYSIIGDESGALISFFLARSLGREAVTRFFRNNIPFLTSAPNANWSTWVFLPAYYR